MLQVKDGFLDKPFHKQSEILQNYIFGNQYYDFCSLGRTHAERENIDTAIRYYERCIDLDEDFACGQNIVATLSELYQTKALIVDMENENLRTVYMDRAMKLFQKLFQKTAELTTFVELAFASLLSRLGRYEGAVKHVEKVVDRADDTLCVSFGNVEKPLVDVFVCSEIEAHGGNISIPIKVFAVYKLISTYMKLDEKEKAQEVTIR